MKPEDRSREALDHLTDRAAQIRAFPPEMQNREALVLVRCPRHALVLRVFGLRSGHLLALPVGQGWIAEIIRRHSGSEWWFTVPPDTQENVMPAGWVDATLSQDKRLLDGRILRGETGVRIGQAATVLDYAPELADAVIAGSTPLDKAYAEARRIKAERGGPARRGRCGVACERSARAGDARAGRRALR